MPSHRDHRATDPTMEPLAYPCIAVACVLSVVAVVALPQLPTWANDYGNELVYPAFGLYSILAALLLRWGWRLRPATSGSPWAGAGHH